MSRSGWFRKQQPLLDSDGTTATEPSRSRRKGRRTAALIASGAAVVLLAGVAIIALASPGDHADPVSAAQAAAVRQAGPAVPLQVLSVTPAAGDEGRQRRGPDPGAVLRAAGR